MRDPTPALALAESMVLAGLGDEVVQSLLEQVRLTNQNIYVEHSIYLSIIYGWVLI